MIPMSLTTFGVPTSNPLKVPKSVSLLPLYGSTSAHDLGVVSE